MIKIVISVCLFLTVSILSPFANAEEYLSGDTFLLAGVVSLGDNGGTTEPKAEGQWSTLKNCWDNGNKKHKCYVHDHSTSGNKYPPKSTDDAGTTSCNASSHCLTCIKNYPKKCSLCPMGYQLASDQTCKVCPQGCHFNYDGDCIKDKASDSDPDTAC